MKRFSLHMQVAKNCTKILSLRQLLGSREIIWEFEIEHTLDFKRLTGIQCYIIQ